MPIFYSAKHNAFYPEELISSYKASGEWPEDAILVDNNIYHEFSSEIAPEGKIRIAGDSGLPEWADLPLPTRDYLISLAESKKNQLLSNATAVIAPLQDAVDLEMATSNEIYSLQEWKKYRVLVNRVDISAAPDIEWPEEPKVAG